MKRHENGLAGFVGAVLLSLLIWPSTASADKAPSPPIPARPEGLSFSSLRFDVPDAKSFRHSLSNGTPVFIAEDHSLPLVQISLTFRAGGFEDPPHKTGLAAMTGKLLRAGGTEKMSAEAFDEKAEVLAARIGSYGADVRSGANMNCLTSVLEECLELFFEMVRTPGFDADRLGVEKGKVLEDLKQRNDDGQAILSREWEWLLNGDYFTGRHTTQAELESITRQDLVEFHRDNWHPDRLIISVSGDVRPRAILGELEARIAAWTVATPAAAWPPPRPEHSPKPGLYFVDKDIPQGKVYIGHPSFQIEDWNHPDLPALRVMNRILGGGGFSSRIVKRVRSDEGLVYHVSSAFSREPFWPSQFRIQYQSKSATVTLAAQLALEQVRSLQEKAVTPEELSLAKVSLVDTFPRRFESARQIAGTYAYDELVGRDSDYWQHWRQRIRAVRIEDVQRVAKQYLHPEEMIFLVVGNWADISAGDPDRPVNLGDLIEGEPIELPLRDPLTLQPIE